MVSAAHTSLSLLADDCASYFTGKTELTSWNSSGSLLPHLCLLFLKGPHPTFSAFSGSRSWGSSSTHPPVNYALTFRIQLVLLEVFNIWKSKQSKPRERKGENAFTVRSLILRLLLATARPSILIQPKFSACSLHLLPSLPGVHPVFKLHNSVNVLLWICLTALLGSLHLRNAFCFPGSGSFPEYHGQTCRQPPPSLTYWPSGGCLCKTVWVGSVGIHTYNKLHFY